MFRWILILIRNQTSDLFQRFFVLITLKNATWPLMLTYYEYQRLSRGMKYFTYVVHIRGEPQVLRCYNLLYPSKIYIVVYIDHLSRKWQNISGHHYALNVYLNDSFQSDNSFFTI